MYTEKYSLSNFLNQCLLRACSGLDWTRGEIEHSKWSCSKVTIAQTKLLNLKELDNVLVLVNLYTYICTYVFPSLKRYNDLHFVYVFCFKNSDDFEELPCVAICCVEPCIQGAILNRSRI